MDVLNWSRWVKRPFNQWVFGTTFSGIAGGCSIFASNSLMDKRLHDLAMGGRTCSRYWVDQAMRSNCYRGASVPERKIELPPGHQ